MYTELSRKQLIKDFEDSVRLLYEGIVNTGLPEKLQDTAFKQGLSLLWGTNARVTKQSQFLEPSGSESMSQENLSGGEDTESSNQSITEIISKLSNHTNTEKHVLAELIHLNGDQLELKIPAINLGESTAKQIRSITLIMATAHAFGIAKGDLPLEEVRLEAKRLRCYDSSNFISQVESTDGITIVGDGKARRITMRSSATRAFQKLIADLEVRL